MAAGRGIKVVRLSGCCIVIGVETRVLKSGGVTEHESRDYPAFIDDETPYTAESNGED